MAAVEAYRGDAEAQDDRTVVVVTYPADAHRGLAFQDSDVDSSSWRSLMSESAG